MIYDEMCKEVAKMMDKIAFDEARNSGKVVEPVLICNRGNKFMLHQIFRGMDLCIYGTDLCDNKIYMVTDKELAENIREGLKYERTRTNQA